MTAEAPLTPEQRDMIERRSGQGVGNGYMGEAGMRGYFSSQEDEDRPQRSGVKPTRSHASHRGGRSSPDEITGADVSRNILNQHEPDTGMTVEERSAQSHAGAERARRFITGDDRIQRLVDETKADEIPNPYDRAAQDRNTETRLNGRLRTYYDKKK